MKCPACGEDNDSVIDTRSFPGYIRRRRQCACGWRWTTKEIPEDEYRQIIRDPALVPENAAD